MNATAKEIYDEISKTIEKPLGFDINHLLLFHNCAGVNNYLKKGKLIKIK